jgi:hypothetical protein
MHWMGLDAGQKTNRESVSPLNLCLQKCSMLCVRRRVFSSQLTEKKQARAKLEEYEAALSHLEGRGDLPWDITVAGKIARNSVSLKSGPGTPGVSFTSPAAGHGLPLWAMRVQELIRLTQNRVAEVRASRAIANLCAYSPVFATRCLACCASPLFVRNSHSPVSDRNG